MQLMINNTTSLVYIGDGNKFYKVNLWKGMEISHDPIQYKNGTVDPQLSEPPWSQKVIKVFR